MTKYQDEYDQQGERLFTDHTVRTVLEQMKKTQYIIDNLSKDELYLAIKPTLKSRSQLTSYIGARGTESKLEKGHHSIAHFANGGMRYTLANFLGMAGLALYNLRIRFRLKVATMNPSKRASIPSSFQDLPAFTNHLRPSYNSDLARNAGVKADVHKDVEILQKDNGERFLYEYYLAQQQRENNGIKSDPSNNCCLCRNCGKVNNPYKKRGPLWERQEDVSTLPSVSVESVAASPQPVTPLDIAPAPVQLLPVAPNRTITSDTSSYSIRTPAIHKVNAGDEENETQQKEETRRITVQLKLFSLVHGRWVL